MVNRSRILAALALLTMISSAIGEEIGAGKSGQELIDFLRDEYRPSSTLSYRAARQAMFSEIDNRDGKVRCVYTGQEIATNGIPNGNVMNAEHTWPQSKFNERSPMRSDLHHLFPTLSRVNSARGNHPFAEIPDTQARMWWITSRGQRAAPPEDVRDEFSESTNQAFEPREDHEGNVARAMLYFWVVYGEDGITPEFIQSQLQALAEWNALDPADGAERQRNDRIKEIQGNDNPFVLDPTLVGRVLGDQFDPRRPLAFTGPAPSPARVADRPALSATENVRFVTWNASNLLNIEAVESRRSDLERFAREAKPDVLLLQGVTSARVVRAVQSAMGLDGYDAACSDFTQDDTQEHESLEVAILSRFPLDQVIEFDPSPDNTDEDEPDEAPLPSPLLRLGFEPVETDRGYLWARIDQIRTTVTVVHLKSSRSAVGPPDESNAKQREFVAAAVAAGVHEDKLLLPGYSYLVAGTFGVGNADEGKLGTDLAEDCLKADCNGGDRYDETHALMSAGLIGGLAMRDLTAAIDEPTYTDGFPTVGPIDNIYVDGPARGRFSEATRISSPFGSSHLAVWTELTVSDRDLARTAEDGTLRPLSEPRAFAPLPALDNLRICSFNIQFLGSFKKRDDAALASILEDYDIVVIQELVAPPIAGTYPDGEEFEADPEAKEFFDEMLALGFTFALSEEDTGTGHTIHSGGTGTEWWITFYRPDRVKVATDLPSGFLAEDRSNHDDFERVPYAFAFRTANDEMDFVLVPVHLKPGGGEAERRQQELAAIATWIHENEDDEQDFIILGDMNIEDAAELAEVVPAGFISLNGECRPTNTNVNGPKPYDHVLFNPGFTTEIDQQFDFQVIDLIAEMKPLWNRSEPFPGGPPYVHNTFRQIFSDHHPVVFQMVVPSSDDD